MYLMRMRNTRTTYSHSYFSLPWFKENEDYSLFPRLIAMRSRDIHTLKREEFQNFVTQKFV